MKNWILLAIGLIFLSSPAYSQEARRGTFCDTAEHMETLAKVSIGQGKDLDATIEEINKASTTSPACVRFDSPPFPLVKEGKQIDTFTVGNHMFAVLDAKMFIPIFVNQILTKIMVIDCYMLIRVENA